MVFFSKNGMFFNEELSCEDRETIKETIAAQYVEKYIMKAKQ